MSEEKSASPTLSRVSELERQYVAEVLENQFRNSSYGVMIRRLEERFAECFDVKYAVAQVNGTATLHSALAAVGVQDGDEVIVPPLTMASTCFAVLQSGGIPVFADVNPNTFTIDPQKIEACISRRTKAIVTVALFGLVPDMDPIIELARQHELRVIEDNAQCYMGYYKGRLAGSIGDMASYSFQISKHLTCGEGGILISDDEGLMERARRFGTLGYASVHASSLQAKVERETIQNPSYERHVGLGWNYRMSELDAAVALAQTERMIDLVAQRSKVAAFYAEASEGCSWLIPQLVPEGFEHSWWTYALKLENGGAFSWEQFRDKYAELGGDGIYAAWLVNYLEPVLRDRKLGWQLFKPGLCQVAEALQSKLFQFKANYMDLRQAQRQAEILRDTIHYFGN